MSLKSPLIEGKLIPLDKRQLPDHRIEILFRETGTVMGIEYTGMSKSVTSGTSGDLFLRSEGTLIIDTRDKDTLSWVGVSAVRNTGRRYVSNLVGIKQYRTTIRCLESLNGKRLAFGGEVEGNGQGWYNEWRIG